MMAAMATIVATVDIHSGADQDRGLMAMAGTGPDHALWLMTLAW